MNYLKNLVDKVAVSEGVPKSVAEEHVKTVLTELCNCFEEGGFSYPGYFTVKQNIRKGRKGVLNGHAYETNDKKVLHITAGKKLSDKMNG